MSFIDMMANDVWSSADIDAKVQAMIRSRYSDNDELKAARLSRNGDDPTFVAAVDAWIADCVQQGRDARADMDLLNEVLAMETAVRRLDQPAVEPEYDADGNIINQSAIDADRAERDAAQTVLYEATVEQRELFEQRNPPQESDISSI